MTDKGKKTSALPVCPYADTCYRKNPAHFKEFSHPAKGATPSTSIAHRADAPKLPACEYGAKCYRKNLLHFAEYSHPTSGAPSDGNKDGSGSDTDVYSSDDEPQAKKAKTGKDGKLKYDLSLTKSFSQMTESERKDMIKKALEIKKQLEQELKETKDEMAKKDKELDHLQNEVNTGLLLVKGEKEALEGKKTTYFTLVAERSYKGSSAEQTHFRLAESQFYRLLQGSSIQKVTKVEYVVNPCRVSKKISAVSCLMLYYWPGPMVGGRSDSHVVSFVDSENHFLDSNDEPQDAREELKQEHGEQMSFPILAFHGTEVKNISLICEGGFKIPGEKGFKHRTDTGWYGKGVYFSEFPSYSMSYITGSNTIMLCQVLPGKVFHCTTLIHGAKLTKGYTSHMSPDQKELVIFNAFHILPSYIVHYTTSTADFTYVGKADSTVKTGKGLFGKVDDVTYDGYPTNDKYNAVCDLSATSVFNGIVFVISGKMQDTQANIGKLIVKHGGSIGTPSRFDYCVATQEEFDARTKKVSSALKRKIKIVDEEFLYDCIQKEELLEIADYVYLD